jgi:hypothetical protein
VKGVGPGPHTLDVRATDTAGNTGPTAHFTWNTTVRPVGEFSGGCSCNTLEPSALLFVLAGLALARRRAGAKHRLR